MKVLVLGATGLLGIPLSDYLEREGYNIIRHGFKSDADYRVDMRDFSEAQRMLDDITPDFIINLIALTDVDRCEKDPNTAYLLNVRPVENILFWALKHPHMKLIHISTDHVYDGVGLHSESDITIRNSYALSKYCAEHVALRGNSCILRTNFIGRSKTPERLSLSDWIVESLTNRRPIKLFTDVKFSPLSIHTLSNIIALVAGNFKTGVFNLGSADGMSKRDFSVSLAEKLGLSLESTEDVLSTDMKLTTYRPTDMRMNSALFEKTFNVKLPRLLDEIELIRGEYELEN